MLSVNSGRFGLRSALPNRRLTSKAVGNQLKSRIVSDIVVANQLEVLTSRLVWRTENNNNAKNLIATKRNQCDALIADEKSVLFFFSCLSCMDMKKRKRPILKDETKDSSPPNSAEEPESSADEEEEPSVYPAINYWIVHTPVPGLNLQVMLNKTLLESDLDITEIKPIRSRGKQNIEDCMAATLQTTVKDHNNTYVKDLLKKSKDYCATELVRMMVVNEPIYLNMAWISVDPMTAL